MNTRRSFFKTIGTGAALSTIAFAAPGKETVGVEYDGKIVEAMIYVMNEGYELGNPSQQYLNVILEGYESADFDPQILSNALTTSARKRKKKGAVQ